MSVSGGVDPLDGSSNRVEAGTDLEGRFLVTEVDGSNPGSSMLFPLARYFICIASVDSALK